MIEDASRTWNNPLRAKDSKTNHNTPKHLLTEENNPLSAIGGVSEMSSKGHF